MVYCKYILLGKIVEVWKMNSDRNEATLKSQTNNNICPLTN